MASYNKIIIVGYLGRDPELRYTPQGNAVCNFSVATTEKRKNVAGEPEETTTWFRVAAWGRLAELCNEYLVKGRQVYIEGRLRQQEYMDREGNRRQSLEVNATEVQFLDSHGGSRDEKSQEREERSSAPSKQQSRKQAPRAEDDDIPF